MCVCEKEREREGRFYVDLLFARAIMDERLYYQYKLNKEFRDFRVSFSLHKQVHNVA